MPARTRRRGRPRDHARIQVAGDVHAAHRHGRRRAVQPQAGAVDRRHQHGPVPCRKPRHQEGVRPRPPARNVLPLAQQGPPQREGVLLRHRERDARGAVAVRGEPPAVLRRPQPARRRERVAHAPRPRPACLRRQAQRSHPHRRRQLPHHARRDRVRRCVPVLRRVAAGGARGTEQARNAEQRLRAGDELFPGGTAGGEGAGDRGWVVQGEGTAADPR